MKPFLDTNVVVYAFIDGEARQQRALDLLDLGGDLSVQVVNEFVSVARRKLKMEWSVVRHALATIESLCGPIRPLTLLTHRAALAISERHHLNLYDALIVASAHEAGCDVLWTEDMADGRRMDGLTIRNPFKDLTA